MPHKARLPSYTVTKSSESDNIKDIRARWEAKAGQDRVGAALQKAEDLKAIELKRGYTWPELWDCPPFVCPKELLIKHQNVNPEKIENINAILRKSWETQASSCPSLCRHDRKSINDDFLSEQDGNKISGYLKYYFNNIPGANDNMRRIVGVIHAYDQAPVGKVSFGLTKDPKTGELKVEIKGDHEQVNRPTLVKLPKSYLKWEYPDGQWFCISNSFVSQIMKTFPNPAEQKFELQMNKWYYDEDPATLDPNDCGGHISFWENLEGLWHFSQICSEINLGLIS